jgi:TPP-dependent pyruvate/acetoin dehydrogenase alpha subunit
MQPGPDLLLAMYAGMLRVRLFEERVRELFAGLDADAVASLHSQLGTLRVHLLEKLNPSETETT